METQKNQLNTAVAAIPSNSKQSNVIRTLTANDVIFWGADAFISVALALFVVTFIEGATVLNVGVALMIYRVVNALSSVPIGRFFDRNKGYLDEVTGLSFACFFAGVAYILLSFSTAIWQLYVVMFCLGITSAINLTSWRILFYKHIDNEQFGQTLGLYQMLYSLGIGLFLVVGGFAGENFGYDRVLLFGGLTMFVGSTLPFLIRSYFDDGKKVKLKWW